MNMNIETRGDYWIVNITHESHDELQECVNSMYNYGCISDESDIFQIDKGYSVTFSTTRKKMLRGLLSMSIANLPHDASNYHRTINGKRVSIRGARAAFFTAHFLRNSVSFRRMNYATQSEEDRSSRVHHLGNTDYSNATDHSVVVW